jgi:hypothetical protein
MKQIVRIAAALVAALALIAVTLSYASADGSSRPRPPAQAQRGADQRAAAAAAPNLEAVFVPVKPCRLVDTRKGGGALGGQSSRNFLVRGTAGFAAQGGTTGGCGIPDSASGVAANVTVTGATGNGFLVGYPAGTIAAVTNFVTYQKAVTTTVNPTFALAAFGSTTDLAVANHGSPAQLIVDVTGYYAPQLHAWVTDAGVLARHTSRVLSSVRDATGAYTVTFDRDLDACSVSVGAFPGTASGSAYVKGAQEDQVVVYFYSTLQGGIPQPTDTNFYLDVTC